MMLPVFSPARKKAAGSFAYLPPQAPAIGMNLRITKNWRKNQRLIILRPSCHVLLFILRHYQRAANLKKRQKNY
jgi:hypothetical protein